MSPRPVLLVEDEQLWEAFAGAERLPDGSPPRFCEIDMQDIPASTPGGPWSVAILAGEPDRGGISLLVELEDQSGAMWLGTDLSIEAAIIVAQTLLAGAPTRERLAALGMRWFAHGLIPPHRLLSPPTNPHCSDPSEDPTGETGPS